MASERTLARRIDGPRARMLVQGPTIAELQPKQIVTANRAMRLAVEARGCTRAQRKELARLRAERRLTGREPPAPEWSRKGPADQPAKPCDVAIIVEDVRGLFERGLLTEGESFDAWRARHFSAETITRRQLDGALGEIMARIKDEGTTDADSQVLGP